MIPIIEDSEDDCTVYNTLMQHKKITDNQIDILTKKQKDKGNVVHNLERE
jgi:hypothetical protein